MSGAANRITTIQEFNDWVQSHTPTLLAKKRQLTFENDYGVEDASAFERELSYFVRSVVPARFREALGGDSATSRAVAHAVIWEDRRQRGASLREQPNPRAVDSLEYAPSLGGVEFEKFVGARLEALGCKVRVTPVTGDQGVDLVATIGTTTIAIQCKRSSTPVGNAAVQQVAAGQRYYGSKVAWVVSDAAFTRAARQLAKSADVRLVDIRLIDIALAEEVQRVGG